MRLKKKIQILEESQNLLKYIGKRPKPFGNPPSANIAIRCDGCGSSQVEKRKKHDFPFIEGYIATSCSHCSPAGNPSKREMIPVLNTVKSINLSKDVIKELTFYVEGIDGENYPFFIKINQSYKVIDFYTFLHTPEKIVDNQSKSNHYIGYPFYIHENNKYLKKILFHPEDRSDIINVGKIIANFNEYLTFMDDIKALEENLQTLSMNFSEKEYKAILSELASATFRNAVSWNLYN